VKQRFFPLFFSVICLDCYSCTSLLSFQDCQSAETKITCPSGPQSCISAGIESANVGNLTFEAYFKGCRPTTNCTTPPSNCQILGAKCDIECCEADLCNDQIPSTPPPTRLSKCYQCLSNVSYEDCDARRIEVSCSPSETCMTLSAIIKNPEKKEEHGFLRGCTSSCLLTQFEGCRPSNVTCDLQCCSSDLCNDQKLVVTDTTPRQPPTTSNLATRSAKGDFFLFLNLFIFIIFSLFLG